VEGKASGQWALLDYGEVIIHVFHHPVREHYDLESLWIDAKRVDIEVPEEARIRAEDMY
jgi:ribosome-associated protein